MSSWIFPANVRWLTRPLLFVFLAYFIQRLLFICTYWSNFSKQSLPDWFEFFWLSIRFDSSAIFSINLLFIVLVLIPFPKNGVYYTFIKWLFIVGNWLFLVLNLADIPFFLFNRRRTTFEVLTNLSSEIQAQAGQLLFNFWPWTLFGFFLLFLLFTSFTKVPTTKNTKWYISLTALLFWVGISVFLIRNSLKLKPLLPGDAFTLRQSEAGNGVLNTPFLLFKTNEEKRLPDQKWLSEAEMKSFLKPAGFGTSGPLSGYNVVIIILESFSTEYTGLEGNQISYSPFLDSLAGASLYFPHHSSSGKTSRDALPSILMGLPSWMNESFMHSQYVSSKTDGLGKILLSKGYKTSFYHGGKNGTMSFDLSSRLSGFEEYFGMSQYPTPEKDFDNHWGIFDQPFLQNLVHELDKKTQPFAATVFTLSSHQPYTIPNALQGKFKKGPLPIHESIAYTDYSLKEFFKSAKNQPWYSKTLFVITADHTQENFEPSYRSIKGRNDTPLLFFCPSQKLVADTSQYVCHIDIRPSILDLLGLKTKNNYLLGGSVFSKKQDFPIVFQDQSYHLLHPDGTLSWMGNDPKLDWFWNPEGKAEEPSNLRNLMVAEIQFYRQGLLKNSLVQP